jgi:hypothetical protein
MLDASTTSNKTTVKASDFRSIVMSQMLSKVVRNGKATYSTALALYIDRARGTNGVSILLTATHRYFLMRPAM